MRTTRKPRRRVAATAALALLVGALLTPSAVPVASAAVPQEPATVPIASAAVPAEVGAIAGAAKRLGTRIAGSYLDRSTGALVVNVTDQATANTVRAAGGVPRFVTRSGVRLATATAELDRSARIPGTAWAVDPVTNQVVITVDSSVTGDRLARIRAVAARLGDAARIETVAATFGVRIAGGAAIYGSSYRCSLGFNVVSGGTYYFLTAGHCGNLARTWYKNATKKTVLGTRVDSSFPGNDYALVKYTNSKISHPGSVDRYDGTKQNIAKAADAYVGQAVARSGSTTHVRTGKVTGLNATVNYAEGTVYGLIRTDVCAESGDSGGPLYAGRLAIGLTSGGTGDCTSGGVTFFQPVTEALAAYRVKIY